MSASLQEQVRIARVNRMKRRVASWWHQSHCYECQARGASAGALLQLFQQVGVPSVSVEVVGDDDTLPGTHVPPSDKAH
ncbi:hypothetical protein [Piscinibacter defluvii]|uniref:hypothetical protein n=1 Tax=Piscinibacter defluvii TaxID=1796922 RepID=UPI000FDE69B9|nr:hypothetical protein [Piscinibacter defluvii]